MTDSTPPQPTTSSRSRGEVVGLAVLLGVASLLVGLVLGWALFGRGGFPLDGSAEAGFARDMQTHHGQAVADVAASSPSAPTDPAVRTMANDIATSQQQQAGQMFAWLQLWGLTPTGSQPPMAWMGSDHHGATSASGEPVPMPGMASAADLAAARAPLRCRGRADLPRADDRPPPGGVEMADAVLARSDREEVVTLARAMKAAQTSEIATMQAMLDARA